MNEQQFHKDQNETNVITQVIQRYLPFWPLFIITTFMAFAVAHVYVRSQQRIFMSTAKVLLKDPNKSGGGESKVLEALNIFSEKKIVDNEIVMLRSTGLMEEVVRELDIYAAVFNKGRVRVQEMYKSNSPVYFIAENKENIQPGGIHSFTVDHKKSIVQINNQTIPFNGNLTVNGTTYKLVPNRSYEKVFAEENFYVVFNSVENAAAGLAGALKVAPYSNVSTVLDLKLETTAPEKGKDILNTLIAVYNRNAIADKNQAAAKTLAFIENRLNLVISQLDSVEQNIESYKSRNAVFDLGEQAKLYLDNVGSYDRQKGEVELQMDVLDQIRSYVVSKSSKPNMAPSTALVNDQRLSTLLNGLYDAETTLEKSRAVAGERSDVVLLAEQNVAKLKQSILENIAALKTNLLTAKSNINAKIGLNSSLLKGIPQREKGLIDISRQQVIKNNIYSYLLQKREETALSSASTIADLRVVEKGASYGPIKPVAKNFYLFAFVCGIMLAALIIMFREQMNRRVLFRHEIEAKTSVPVIAEVMQMQNSGPVVIEEGKRTAAAEQFRSLRTNLSFMGVSESANTILLTSSVSGEGKSFMSINLAISFALMGKRVAIMELDLRKPKLSKTLALPKEPGITNYLVGQASLEQIIKPTDYANLFLISSGPIPPNPSELLLKKEFAQLMKEVKEMFDYVIIDTTPIGPVTDAFLLKNFADATCYVVRHDVTPKTYLKLLDEMVKGGKFRNMAIVFNGLKKRGFSYYGSGYGNSGYGYGYGSGYGYYNDEPKNGKIKRISKRLLKSIKIW